MNLFFGSFRKADADDPETFTAGCLRLFTAYPPEAVRYVVDPVTGLPGRSEWLPSMKAVRDALEAWAAERRRERDFEQRQQAVQQQIAERKAWLDGKTIRPTLAELKEKHGPNYGIERAFNEDLKVKESRNETIAAANSYAFAEECKEAGIDPATATVSPTLAAMIKARTA